MSLGIAWLARRIARRPADAKMTFGYGRAELVAALVNYTTLVVIALWLGWEGVARLLRPAAGCGLDRGLGRRRSARWSTR